MSSVLFVVHSAQLQAVVLDQCPPLFSYTISIDCVRDRTLDTGDQ